MATSRSARSSERLGSALVLAVMGAAAAYVYVIGWPLISDGNEMLRIADSRSAISTYALKPPSSSQVDLWDSTIKAADRIAAYRRFLDEVTLFMDNGYDDYTPEPTPEHTTPPTTASPDPTPTVIPTLSPTESPTTPAITPAPTATSAPKELDTVREEIKSGLTEDERQAIKAADLSDLQNAGDQFGSVLDPVLVNVISGTEANELADNICNGDNVNAAVDFGMGTSGKTFMKQCDLVVRTIVGVQTAFTQDDRRKLLESRDLGYSIDAYNIGNVNANIYLLFASIVAGDPDFTPAVVRFYELRASSAKLLLDTGNKFASAVVIGITDLTADGRSSSEEVIPPGDLIGLLPEGRLTESQVTSLLEGLQRVSMSDDLDYRKDRKRERKVVRDVKGLLAEQGLDDGSGTEEGASAVDNGEVNSAVYYPSEQFQQKWANEVMRAAGGHGFSRRLLDESGRVTVTAVVFYRSTTADGGSVAFASVAYTVRLAEGRCFLCDRRDVFSSETDSEKHSELKSTSVASSSQTNFRDSARYNCPRDRTFRYGGYAYQVALFQGLFTQGCSTCGNFVPTCANHASASEAYASEQAVLATFTGSEKVEKSKHLGGKKLVDPYDVPNKKVFYEENGAPASSEQFDTKTVRVGDTVIKIPTKGR